MQTIRTHLVGGSVRPGRKPDLIFSGGLDRRLALFWHGVFEHGLVKKATLKVELDMIFAGAIPLKVVKVSECLEIWLPLPEADEQVAGQPVQVPPRRSRKRLRRDEVADEPE